MLKDIFDLEKISSTELYRRLMEFMIDNISCEFSVNSITNYLKNEKRKPKNNTIMNYLLYALNAYLLYKVKRKDLRVNQYLKPKKNIMLLILDFIIYLIMKVIGVWAVIGEYCLY
jgi:predicted AAA+ superfamily ATPase